jgi:hypothetical protein
VRVPYSERERGVKPRTSEVIDERTWSGLVTLINKRVDDGSFGYGFPVHCQDGLNPVGTNERDLATALQAEVEVMWPLRLDEMPADQLAIFDMLEYLCEVVGKPNRGFHHSYFQHYHLIYDQEAGRAEFADAVNRVFARNEIAFELHADGLVRRLLPEHLGGFLGSLVFHTGDAETDRLLDYARNMITLPSLDRRRDGLEKLWDAFERMKTLEPGTDKRAQAEAMLDRVTSGPIFREQLTTEAKALTDAGNKLRIRHSEINQEFLQTADQVDYLYFRMFSFLRLMLRASGRGM